jgi:hypothetical protein
MKARYLSGILMLLIALGCSTTREVAPPPNLNEQATPPANLPVSRLSLPIRMTYTELEGRFNANLPELLYEDRDFDNNGGDNLRLVVKRTGGLRLSAVNDYFRFTLPLHIWVEGRVKSSLGGLFAPANAPSLTKAANFYIEVVVASKLQPQSDWRIVTSSTVNFNWTEQPNLDFGLVKLPIGGLIEKVINGQLAQLAKQIDAEAAKQLRFKPQIERYWQQIQQPIRLSGPVPAVLYLMPESIGLGPIKPGKDALNLQTVINSRVLVSTDSLRTESRPKPLPPLELISQPIPHEAELMLTASLSYQRLSSLANEQLAGKTYTFDKNKHRIKIESIETRGVGTKIQAKVALTGSAKTGIIGRKKLDGVYYFTGTPYYDSTRQEIAIHDFDFDIKSRDLLLNSAEWLFKSNFRKMIAQQLRYPLAQDLAQMRLLAEQALNKPFSNEIQLQGKVLQLYPTEIRLEATSMLLYIVSRGELALQLR